MTEYKSTPAQEKMLKKIASRNSYIFTEKQFCRAAAQGDVWLMDQLYKSGYKSIDGHPGDIGALFLMHWDTPLESAIKNGKVESVLWLVDHGAQLRPFCRESSAPGHIYIAGHKGPLFHAAEKAEWGIVKLLLEKGANPAVDDHAALIMTLRRGGDVAAQMMRDKMASPLSPLLISRMKDAAREGKIDITEIIKDRPLLPAPQQRPVAVQEEKQKIPPPVVEIVKSSPSPWQKTGEQEVSHVVEKKGLQKTLTDIFNFDTRERILIIDDAKYKTSTALKEHFDSMEARPLLEEACEQFMKLGGTVSKDEVMTKGFVKRNKKDLPSTGL